ncbi:MAG TPA: acyl-CoA synthetase [Acidimicrobiales bacterium]|nr:acyl-CoA synthetase [Acidimicrobiales bacterium]
MEANLADLFEFAVDHFGPREYLVAGGERRTYAQMEERANRLAHHLLEQGVRPGDHVGIYACNCVEWVETLWAVFKVRAVWINVNYRYVADELRHIFSNADLVGLVHAREFGPRVAEAADALPGVRFSLVIDDASGHPYPRRDAVPYEEALAGAAAERDFPPRSGDDRYILYTGGTTGLPKGVVWRHEDVFYALGGGIDAVTNHKVSDPGDLTRAAAGRNPTTFLACAPLMHGASQWGVMGQAFQGNKVVLVRHFDPVEVWRLVEAEKVNVMFITGDAMGRPLVEALSAGAAGFDTSSLLAVASTAATFSPSVKDDFFRRFPNLIMTDSLGSSEGGAQGVTVVSAGRTAMKSGPTVSGLSGTVVLDERMRPVEPGSGVVGRVARTGHIPIGYYKDPEKTAATFVEVDGVRYAIPGDFATVEADGTITLLGRGSVCINSGGEKIFPEEVEAVLKAHPAVFDATVVGAPDERWGQRVAAVVELRPGMSATLEELQQHCRASIAGYKVPRQLEVVDRLVRSPSGKPDYTWAAAVAAGRTAPTG